MVRKVDITWPRRALGAVVLACLPGAGCATMPAEPPLAYDELADQAVGDRIIDANLVTQMEQAFLATPDFDERIRAVTLLEDQVDALLPTDQPLRLGPLGSAILDHYRASITGHRALAKFYSHVDLPEQAAIHVAWIDAIVAAVESEGDGSLEAPYAVLSTNEAEGYLSVRGRTPVGATYRRTNEHPFMLWIAATRENRPLENVFFDLDALYSTIAASVRRKPTTVFPAGPPETCASLGLCDKFDPLTFIQILARGNDSAALAFLGLNGLGRNQDAMGQLILASRSGNALANRLLAEWWREVAFRRPKERKEYLLHAEEHYGVAIRAGFDDAMVDLGELYLNGEYGPDKTAAGLSLVTHAAQLDNTDALVTLGWLYVFGPTRAEASAANFVERDHARAEQYFLRASELDQDAKLEYARFLMHPEVEQEFNKRAYQWLRQIAKNENADAMVLIGDLYARGLHVGKNFRRAQSWFKHAVKAAPDNPYLVNEVAWRLAVTHLTKLRDERYALEIMERIMADSVDARRTPAYLDTWAAAYAANGDFERAIAVQEQAVEAAQTLSADELPILLEHLEAFRAGEEISEQVP